MTDNNPPVVIITVSAPVGSGKSFILTEIEAAMKVAGCDVAWPNAEREHGLIAPATLAKVGLTMPKVVLVEHDSGTSAHWDAWYAGLPLSLRRKLSFRDFKQLGDLFKAAFLLRHSDHGSTPTPEPGR